MTYDDLVGKEFLFYGVDNQLIKLDDFVIEIMEDPDDGYRSMLGEVIPRSKHIGLFFREPVAIVTFCKHDEGESSGYALRDEEYNHLWLEFGTDESDSYYPCFYFNYHPRPHYAPKVKKSSVKKIHDHEINSFDRLFDQRDV